MICYSAVIKLLTAVLTLSSAVVPAVIADATEGAATVEDTSYECSCAKGIGRFSAHVTPRHTCSVFISAYYKQPETLDPNVR
jgi:hypothetical protein